GTGRGDRRHSLAWPPTDGHDMRVERAWIVENAGQVECVVLVNRARWRQARNRWRDIRHQDARAAANAPSVIIGGGDADWIAACGAVVEILTREAERACRHVINGLGAIPPINRDCERIERAQIA